VPNILFLHGSNNKGGYNNRKNEEKEKLKRALIA
jgi:hypothetical protein